VRATRGCSGAFVAYEPASFVTSTVFVDAETSLQSPPRSHRHGSSTPRLRCHAPTLRRWKWKVESDALTLVVTSTIIDCVTPSANGYRRHLLCVSGRSTRPPDDDIDLKLVFRSLEERCHDNQHGTISRKQLLYNTKYNVVQQINNSGMCQNIITVQNL